MVTARIRQAHASGPHSSGARIVVKFSASNISLKRFACIIRLIKPDYLILHCLKEQLMEVAQITTEVVRMMSGATLSTIGAMTTSPETICSTTAELRRPPRLLLPPPPQSDRVGQSTMSSQLEIISWLDVIVSTSRREYSLFRSFIFDFISKTRER